jgi:hypothetical protein
MYKTLERLNERFIQCTLCKFKPND